MNSDYIPRLRRELVRAAERRQSRWRWRRLAPGLRPVLVGAAVALAAVAIVVAVDRRGGELPADALKLDYRAAGVDGEWAAAIMRARLSAAGVGDARSRPAPTAGWSSAARPARATTSRR